MVQAHPDLFPPTSQSFSLDAYHLQGSRVLSRSFTVSPRRASLEDKDDGDEGSDDEDEHMDVVMIPIADMLNAAAGLDNAHLSELSEGYGMETTASIQSGAQIVCA